MYKKTELFSEHNSANLKFVEQTIDDFKSKFSAINESLIYIKKQVKKLLKKNRKSGIIMGTVDCGDHTCTMDYRQESQVNWKTLFKQ